MRRPHAAAVVLLLWLALLTLAFHGWGGRLACGGRLALRWRPRSSSVAVVPRKILLAVTTFDAAASPTDHHNHHHHHHNPNRHHHQHHHHQQHHRHRHADRWNWKGIPPSAAGKGEGIDPRYGVQKRLVPTGPNPLHH